MEFKYSKEIAEYQIGDVCPPGEAKAERRVAFRFSFADCTAPENFTTQNQKNPRRRNSRGSKGAICNSVAGLSNFADLQSASNKFNSFDVRVKTLLGFTHVAKGTLMPEDGVVTPPENCGHFTLFERSGVDLSNRFTIISKLF